MAKGQILIVDDETIVRRAVARLLAPLGYDLVEACCGNDAIQLLSLDLKRANPLIRLVCLDWLMPRGSGRDVLQWKKGCRHPASILIMTAYGSNQISNELNGFKVDAVMTKPFENLQKVRDQVMACL